MTIYLLAACGPAIGWLGGVFFATISRRARMRRQVEDRMLIWSQPR